jgi:hypothetical protein
MLLLLEVYPSLFAKIKVNRRRVVENEIIMRVRMSGDVHVGSIVDVHNIVYHLLSVWVTLSGRLFLIAHSTLVRLSWKLGWLRALSYRVRGL